MAESLFNKYTKEIIEQIGSSATYTAQLNTLGKFYFGSLYHGTYPSDQLPKLTKYTPYAIINVDSSKMKGSHWIALSYSTSKTLVFDSFGRPTRILTPTVYKKYITEDADYDKNQKYSEDTCGQRCIAFLRVANLYGNDVAKLI